MANKQKTKNITLHLHITQQRLNKTAYFISSFYEIARLIKLTGDQVS